LRHGSKVLLGGVIAIPFCFCFCLWSTAAGAETTVAGDLDYAAAIDSPTNGGWGFGGRLGQRLHVPLLVINPELGFTYHAFADAPSPKLYRGIGGLRLGVGEVFRLGVSGHLGVGRLSLPDAPAASHTAFTYDVGALFDLTVLPLLDVGVHATYTRVASGDRVGAFQFATAGAHAALVF